MKIREVVEIVEGELTVNKSEDTSINAICIDSRLSSFSANELFIAFKGTNSNGHHFVNELIQNGVKNFIVEEDVDVDVDVEANIVQVPSCLQALQKLGQFKRSSFKGKIIGITGSNGKTITKEWLTAILSVNKSILSNPKSYNSQIGVPLSVWPLTNQHDIGVFEAGISKPNEMVRLESILKPEIGIFTNIGTAHDENFLDKKEKVLEKLQLFKNSKALIYDRDDLQLHILISENFKGEKVGWSKKLSETTHVSFKNGLIRIHWKGNDYEFKTEFSDDASFQNITNCLVCALFLGLNQKTVQEGMSRIKPVKMRLELKKGIRGNEIIDDTYNNDIAGLSKALHFMEQQAFKGERIIILSDFIQSKLKLEDFKALNALLISNNISHLLGVGPVLLKNEKYFTLKKNIFLNTNELIKSNILNQFHGQQILIKGSRKFELEKISYLLTAKTHRTTLEINLDAVKHNFLFYKSLLKPSTKIMAVIKALAYGSGSTEVARLLEFNRVDYLAVAYADEGIALRKDGVKAPIMVMNPSDNEVYSLAKYDLEPEIYSLDQLEYFHQTFNELGKPFAAHLVINTGMNRLGFSQSEIGMLKAVLTSMKGLVIKSIFSHLAASDEPTEEEFTLNQIKTFEDIANQLSASLTEKPFLHILNSGGITRYNEYQFDMVRLGIGLHGVEVNKKHENQLQKPAILKTVISQVREIKAGETIGYGRKGLANKDMKIAVIAIGYADGYLRVFGNGNAFVLVNGQKARTIGNVCMDMTMIDITNIETKAGGEVVVFGQNPRVEDLAKWANTIPYEILTNISDRVKRVFYTE